MIRPESFRPENLRRELGAPLFAIQGELNRIFDEYWRPIAAAGAAARPVSPAETDTGGWMPAIDLSETDNEIVLRVDLPGVDPGQVELSVSGDVLNISGNPTAPTGDEGRPLVRERPAGHFARKVSLPSKVDVEGISAEVRQGVLTVRLPKQEGPKPRTIPILPA